MGVGHEPLANAEADCADRDADADESHGRHQELSGGEPANFLDVGGSANAQTVEAGFKIILKDPAVKAILINIFGGIVRCDRVAQGVIDAYKKLGNISIPIIVRLQGTNATEAKKLIDESGLKVQSAILLSDAADLVKKAVA